MDIYRKPIEKKKTYSSNKPFDETDSCADPGNPVSDKNDSDNHIRNGFDLIVSVRRVAEMVPYQFQNTKRLSNNLV